MGFIVVLAKQSKTVQPWVLALAEIGSVRVSAALDKTVLATLLINLFMVVFN